MGPKKRADPALSGGSGPSAIGWVFASVRRFAATLAALGRWRRFLVLFAAGALVNLALPPVGFVPALYLAVPVLLWCLGGATGWRGAFAMGWWFGFGYFVIGLYWIGGAMLVSAGQHAWLIPFSTLGLPAFLALFFGLAAIPTVWATQGLSRALILTVALGAAEWLRGHLFTGFPWNLLGQAWTGPDILLQGVSVFGIYGITVLALLSASLVSLLAAPRGLRVITLVAAGLALPALIAAYGAVRLAGSPPVGKDFVPGVGLRIVQAGIPQKEKWQRRFLSRNFARHLAMSAKDRPAWITHVIWPETASPFAIGDHSGPTDAAAKIVPAGGALITGMIRRKRQPGLQIWNAALAIDAAAGVLARYDKAHLVPFGEYVPLKQWLPIEKITAGNVGYTAGPGPVVWRLPGLPPVTPLICYEVIFPGAVTPPKERPDWLLVLTNDAWYGNTAGPHQHLALARIRAVEEGLPVVRAANTGMSAVYDGYGREWRRLALSTAGVLDSRLPRKPGKVPFYVQNAILLVVAFLLLSLLAYTSRKIDMSTYETP
jgi:apolipoprotein N-acyltransferase